MPKPGKFFDKYGNLLGTCTFEYPGAGGGTLTTTFYDLEGDVIGTCSGYLGPGSSGGCKTIGDCSTDTLRGGEIKTGVFKGKMPPRYQRIFK